MECAVWSLVIDDRVFASFLRSTWVVRARFEVLRNLSAIAAAAAAAVMLRGALLDVMSRGALGIQQYDNTREGHYITTILLFQLFFFYMLYNTLVVGALLCPQVLLPCFGCWPKKPHQSKYCYYRCQ